MITDLPTQRFKHFHSDKHFSEFYLQDWGYAERTFSDNLREVHGRKCPWYNYFKPWLIAVSIQKMLFLATVLSKSIKHEYDTIKISGGW